MNHFIKVGNVIMNIAHISSVIVQKNNADITIYVDPDGEPRYFYGDEAKALLNYFTSIAQDLMASSK